MVAVSDVIIENAQKIADTFKIEVACLPEEMLKIENIGKVALGTDLRLNSVVFVLHSYLETFQNSFAILTTLHSFCL